MRIATFTPVSNQALKTKELPKRIKVMSFGKSTTLDDPVFVTEKTLRAFDVTQKQIGRTRVPLDFNHNTVPGSVAYSADKEPRAIAGYGTPRVGRDGIWLEDITWTPSGETAARDYEDLSPAPLLDDDGVVIGLHSVALTPTGAIEDLHFYSADSILKDMKTLSSEDPKMEKLEEHLEEDVKEQEHGIKKDKEAIKDLEKHEEKDEEVQTLNVTLEAKGNSVVLKPQDDKSFEDNQEHDKDCDCPKCAMKQDPKTLSTDDAPHGVVKAAKAGDTKTRTMSAVEPKAYVTEPQQNKTFVSYMHEEIKKLAAEMNIPDEAELTKRLRYLLGKWLGESPAEVPEGPMTNKANSTPAQFSAEVKNLNDRIAVLEQDRNEAIARYEAQEKQSIVSEATRNGKVIPFSADEIKELSPKLLKSVVDKLPKEVPTKVTTRVLSADGKSAAKPSMSDAANAWQEAVNTALAR